MKKSKKILSLVLVFALTLSLMSVGVFAASASDAQPVSAASGDDAHTQGLITLGLLLNKLLQDTNSSFGNNDGNNDGNNGNQDGVTGNSNNMDMPTTRIVAGTQYLQYLPQLMGWPCLAAAEVPTTLAEAPIGVPLPPRSVPRESAQASTDRSMTGPTKLFPDWRRTALKR